MIAVVDYGAGNLRSIVNAFAALGREVALTSDAATLREATAIVLPGVGAFGAGMAQLRERDLVGPLNEAVRERRVPFLGVCLGMQFMATRGEEHGHHDGLGWLDATVVEIVPPSPSYRVPHMGWNDVAIVRPSPLFAGLTAAAVFFFVHGYHLVPRHDDAFVTATCSHGVPIVAAVQQDNMFGVQFHPEKSQADGLAVLRNFLNYVENGSARAA
jgi:glutamine amidotransferase